jgi:phosphonate transport system substrate-binding protein
MEIDMTGSRLPSIRNRFGALLLGLGLAACPAQAAERVYSFGVLNQRSITLTAEYWNPILRHVGDKSGVKLNLRIARTANETTDMAERGELDFVYTNHFFTPDRDKMGFGVLARQEGAGIRGQVVVAENSPVRKPNELEGREVAFANPYGFTGYFVPMDSLLRAGVKVNPVFAGNQEAAMGLLKLGKVAAAGVNSQVMADFARREDFKYRILADSDSYFDLCVMAHPRVPAEVRQAVRAALVGMQDDIEGRAVLAASAALLELKKPRGFVSASDKDYDNYRAFFRNTRVPVGGQ